MPEMDALSIVLLTITLLSYFGVILFLLLHSDKLLEVSNDVSQSLEIEGKLLLALIHAILVILWPLVMWVGIIKITLEGRWDEVLKGKDKPPR